MTHAIVQRVRHELKLRDLAVTRIERPSPGFLAITFSGEALADFTSLSFDDHVKLMFDDDADGDNAQVRRDYTPRRFDREARELTLEFALHGDGKASEWARRAVLGQQALVGGPRGSLIIPLEVDWHLLAGDETALPAIARRLEELPQGARAEVLLLADAADARQLATRADAHVRWCASAEELLSALRGVELPSSEGFAWAAGEAALMKALRQILDDKGLARERTRVSAYWKRGVADHHEHLD
ncbi:siderophore-interacting protein [Massilia sp. 9096]|uniref:siderophore-interacting protein n=1 Tax=Massilia sp. 9096 TaxID=1500894 RepID=UPI00056C4CD1|nr:siderophore-interacting protein [Massilia sp. 9096]